jgi:hypothetical protein
MSNNNRKIQSGNTVEGSDLSDLCASKETTLKPGEFAPANEADLSIASIPPSDVMRVSQRPEVRRTIGESLEPTKNPETGDPITKSPISTSSVTLTNSRSRSESSKSAENGKMGLFKNPFYRYDGGLMNKLMAFIGNILKLIERFILRLLGMSDEAPMPQQNSASPKNKADTPDAATDAANKEEKARDKRKEKIEEARAGARRG